MAALPVNAADQEASEVRYLLEFAKFQKDNPDLSPSQCAESFLIHNVPFSTHQPGTTTAAIQINRNLTSQSIFKPESCPQSGTASLTGGQRMARGNSTQTSSVSPQHAFAMRAGRSPQQFQYTNPVSLSSSLPQREMHHHHHHHYPSGAPSVQTLQSLGIDSNSAPALEEYLGQNNRHEPFHGLSRGTGDDHSGFGGTRMFKEYQALTIDPTICAQQMRHQLSSSASDYLTGGEESYLDSSPQSFSYPMNRHSRSYSHGSFNSSIFSSSQADSASPTDHLVFGQNPGSYTMSRQASGASLIPGGLSMLRVRSSAGDSITDSMGSACGGDIDGLLNGVGGFASENGDVSSLDKASAQIVLKRSSSVSVDDLKDSMAMKGVQGQHHRHHNHPAPSSPPNPRKQRRIKEENIDVDNMDDGDDGDAARQPLPEKPIKSEIPTKPGGGASRQQEKKSPGGGGSSGGGRHLPTIKPGKNPNNAPVSTVKPSYIRPPHPRVYCDKCNAHPEGFRGDHELRRHTDREHAPTRKMYVIKDISRGETLLSKCKACLSGKKYGVDYNAAAHLRRQHFKPKTRSGKNKQKIPAAIDQTAPEMAELRKWMEVVEVRVEVRKDGDLYTKRDPKKNEYATRTHHEEDDIGDETSEENDEENQQMDEREEGRDVATTYQEIAGQKIQRRQSALEIFPEMEQGLDSGDPSSQADLTWTLNSYSGSTVSGAYTLSNTQQLTHDFDFHVSATTGSVPLVGGAFNHQQNLEIHLPTQHTHQMLMQDSLLLPPTFTHENNNAVFNNYLPTTSRSSGMFDDPFGGLQELFQGDLKPY